MHIEDVDLNLLKALEVLLEERQVSRAAARFHLSQPAMSRTLTRLRAAFDDDLLVRTAQGYVLTPRARAVQAELTELMPRLRSMVSGDMFQPATAVGVLRVAASDYFLAVLADLLYPAYFGAAPGMSLVVEPVNSATFDDIDRGRVDLAFLPVRPPRSLRHQVLFSEDHVCLMARDHPLTGDRVTLDDLGSYPHAGVAALQSEQMLVQSRLEQLGVRPPAGLTVPYFAAAAAAVRGNRMIAVLPRRFAAAHQDAAVRIAEAPAELAAFDYLMIWHPRVTSDPAHRWMRSLMAEAGAALDAGARERP
ncbi:LysR family transcriptional regulator [Actinacidiphila yeochonensis]|uniref:LysR family transcriptional regulator n=1 Tax=Actinacidiphila yeochonensis TaxID=89050 RepID=UPI000AF87D02|nr:LysR family transcriptional regulator [Actinacidiphila yeochonensis]